MSKLVYCSYNLIDQDSIPDWVEKLTTNPMVLAERWGIYNPIEGFVGNIERSVTVAAVMAKAKAAPLAYDNRQQLRLDPMLFQPLNHVMNRLRSADQSPTLDVAFKNLYALLRSDIVVVDLDGVGHGEPSQEVLYAYLCGVPVVGIAHRFILSPWILGKVDAVIFPRTSDEIVQQILAYDRKTSVLIDHYRMEQEREQQRDIDEAEQARQASRESRRAKRRASLSIGGAATTSTVMTTPDGGEEPYEEVPEKVDGEESGDSPV